MVIDGEKLEETWTIQNVLEDKSMPEPLSRQIHVLVVPSHVRLDVGGPSPKVLKYKQQGTDDGCATYNSSYIPFWWSLKVLLWPMEDIQKTKKDV
ncbi:hypothetical protein JM18_009635 [Phytophthora kernoviae]|uniref:Uncharacterized protein n=2 Tax=Phytophthora kernoviae TaxID=325452 RepID=A0A921S8P8_9STRA|nr:hypothetical protein G195_011706 [Phytophthora kernoviae 00238/432]KAG2503541.1 hypothetical protein JM18_009635 [Phytophthora kernoviae]